MVQRKRFCLNGAACLALSAIVLIAGCQSPPAAPAAPAATAPPAAPTPAPKPAAPTAAPAAAPAQAPATPVVAAPAAAPETLKVGISASLSGPTTRVGLTIDRFVRLAIDEINAKGGVKVGGKVYRLDAVTVDDKSTSDGGRDAASRLVLSEKVKFILGSVAPPAAGAQPITEPNKVVLLTSSSQDKSIGPKFPFTLQVGMSNSIIRSNAIYQWLAKEHPEVKRIAQVMTDDASGRAISDYAEPNAKAHGMTIVAKEFHPLDIKDFTPLLTRVLRQNPDAIETVAGGRGPLFLDMMKILVEMDFKGEVFSVGADVSAMEKGAPFIRKFTTATLANWRVPVVGDLEKQVIQRGIDKYGEAEIEVFQSSNYNIPTLLAQALEKAGTVDDTAKIIQVMREGQWDTMYSPKWGKSGFSGVKTFGLPVVYAQPVYLSRVEGGKITTFTAIMATLP